MGYRWSCRRVADVETYTGHGIPTVGLYCRFIQQQNKLLKPEGRILRPYPEVQRKSQNNRQNRPPGESRYVSTSYRNQ
jgi:hypothetical protein